MTHCHAIDGVGIWYLITLALAILLMEYPDIMSLYHHINLIYWRIKDILREICHVKEKLTRFESKEVWCCTVTRCKPQTALL